ncbi:PREDICTED: membrane metallo-endopeptidase-like 1 [Trachymyrmex septentrionalis]|uniref:membrane metallo-endopeptidase-like 1 n=1 Tax=Trachymyrmex septentrionalis TaxID=34720 RepID=UPI00084F4686|nr:PREDICTED: membrane metallo-endopeptidase-like 1 [Trachymyrmex septentrionalis]
MRRLILLAFVGTFLTRDVTLSKIQEYPSNLAWLFGISENTNMKEKRAVCESEECKKMADFILGGMNRSVNPCDDFYEYACGKWPEKNAIPEGLYQWDIWIKLQLKTYQQVYEIVQSKITKNDLPAVKLAKKWYKACMDTDAIEKEGIDPLVSTLSYLGGWPMTMEPDKWDERKYSWEKVDDQYMRLTARNAFYDVHIKKDSEDLKRVEIDTPHLPPGSKKLWSLIESDSKEKDEETNKESKPDSKSDEDPSNEDEQSNEQPGSESEDDSNTIEDDDNDDNDDNDNDDNDDNDDNNGSGDDDNDDDDNDDDNGSGDEDNDDDGSGNDNNDDDDDTDKQDENIKKEISKNKIISKIGHEKSKKLRHIGQKKSGTRIIKKHDSHNKMKRQRTKRWATKVNNKQHFIRRKKLHTQKSKRNHVRKVHRKRTKKILGNAEIMYTTIPQESSKRTKKILESYANYISKVAYIIAKNKGTKISEERLAEDIQDMIEFQLKLIQIAKESIFNSTIYYMEITLRDFQEWYDNENPKTNKGKINWVSKIKGLFDEAYESVDDDLILNIISPNYIKELLSLLDETSSRTIVNYIHWNFISKIIKTTTSEMKNLYDAWERDISKNKNETSSRASICIDSAEIKEILAYEFVRKYFSDETVKTASDMLNDIKKEVEKLIKDSDWLNDETKDFFIEKVKHMNKSIGYPDWYKNTTIMQEYLKELVIGPSYYENALRYNRYVKLESLRKLSKNDDEIDGNLKLDPTEINAFYIPYKNTLSITAADFQSPWFAYGRPQAVNFGIIGFLMAHEVNHGFDHTGRMFDKNGDPLDCFLMMAEAYDKKENCFINQFNNYPIDSKANKKIEDYGKQTIDDNIADTMGLQAIFKTFRSKEKESKIPEAALPGMEDFTNDQLFFLSFSTLWCKANKYTSSEIIDFAKNDEHSVERLRVIGSVSNSDDFAKAYNCPIGSPMNPEKKCNIWK